MKRKLQVMGLAVAANAMVWAVGPENAPANVVMGTDGNTLSVAYHGGTLLAATFPAKPMSNVFATNDAIAGREPAWTQRITLTFPETTTFTATVYGSEQAIAAETRGSAQKRFPLVRTAHGPSHNLRNTALYERRWDWMLEFPEGTRIRPMRQPDGTFRFAVSYTGKEVTLTFRPRYYQSHKGLAHYAPWTYDVKRGSITGWSSWWAYFRNCTEADIDRLLAVWEKERLADYGYRFIQLDDVYQGEHDRARHHVKACNGYCGGEPSTWLDWRKDLFPGGLGRFVSSVRKAGFDPALWVSCCNSYADLAEERPEWFVTGTDGKPLPTPWVGHVLNAADPAPADALIRPTFRGLRQAGVSYVKIDQLRHMCYDGLNHANAWRWKKGLSADDVQRAYLTIAREELGKDAFILSCWGVNPAAIGLVDACRIGGDGYGPITLQQYNSWNGLVWRNDPDHCDIKPDKQADGEVGNVKKTVTRASVKADTVIRPALASIAGAMLLLSDRPEVYENPQNTYGIKRVAPVVFSVPGQLYDFDPRKSDWFKRHTQADIRGGAAPAPCDGDQFGDLCPFWLNEFDTDFDHWSVLHRLNWPQKGAPSLPAQTIAFADLGLKPDADYLVYDFWSGGFLGVCRGSFGLPELPSNSLESWVLREAQDRPQLLSTSRHLSHGCVDIERLHWADANTLRGRSRAIQGEPYTLTFHLPNGTALASATFDGQPAAITQEGNLLHLRVTPAKTASYAWELRFQ